MAANTPNRLGTRLESDRLKHRAVRLQAVVAVLHDRAAAQRAAGARPAEGLTAALGDFERELRAVRAQLHASDKRPR